MKERLLTPSAEITVPKVFTEKPPVFIIPAYISLKIVSDFGIPSRLKEVTVSSDPEIGSRRLVVRLARHLRRGIGRGPCFACDRSQDEGHHGGSKCRKRGTIRFKIKSQQPPISISSVSRPSRLLRRNGVVLG